MPWEITYQVVSKHMLYCTVFWDLGKQHEIYISVILITIMLSKIFSFARTHCFGFFCYNIKCCDPWHLNSCEAFLICLRENGTYCMYCLYGPLIQSVQIWQHLSTPQAHLSTPLTQVMLFAKCHHHLQLAWISCLGLCPKMAPSNQWHYPQKAKFGPMKAAMLMEYKC